MGIVGKVGLMRLYRIVNTPQSQQLCCLGTLGIKSGSPASSTASTHALTASSITAAAAVTGAVAAATRPAARSLD